MKLARFICLAALSAVFCSGIAVSAASSQTQTQTQTQTQSQSPIPLSMTITGDMFWNLREESGLGKGLSQIPRREFRLSVDPRFALWGVELTGKMLYSSLDDVSARARNRLYLSLERGPARVNFGDGYANASKFVTKGARIRGVAGFLMTDQVRVSLLDGESKRSAVGEYDDAAERVMRFGTYARNLTSLNVEVHPNPRLTVKASLGSGEDDTESILHGRKPRSNTAYGADLDYVAVKQTFSLGASVGSSDTEVRATEHNLAESYDGNLAYEVRGTLRVKSHHLSANYYSKDTHYESFAAPTLTPDREGFEVEDQFPLLSRRITVTANFRRQENNVDGEGEFTLAINRPSLGLSVKQGKHVPRIQITAYRSRSSNDAGVDHRRRVDHHLDEGRIRLSKDISVQQAKVTPSVSFKHQRRADKARPESEFKGMNLQVSTRVATSRYTPTLRASYLETDYDSSLRATRKRTTLSLAHILKPSKRLQISGKQAYTLETIGPLEAGKRLEFEAGVVYRLIPKKLDLTTTFKYFDFSSESRAQSNYDGFNIQMKISTVGAVELVPKESVR